MNLADNLKKIRKENNLSQEQLAEKLGVSRQSVSKWESNQAYPEMDKVLEICKMFNLNIDELMNQDIKEVNENRQTKININKIVDDFLAYITKIIDVFSSMKFKQKVKCITEQIFIGVFLAIIMVIIGAILLTFIQDLISILPENINYIIYQIFFDLYVIACLILGICLLLHIFKVRYLDYYDIVKTKEEIVEEKDLDTNKEKTIVLKKKENIIIRDPEHSSYKFISGMLKCLLFVLKLFAVLFAIACCGSLIMFVILFIVSFMFIETGLVFVGFLLAIIACIIISLITLNILYNFIVSKKNKKKILSISFLISLLLVGIGIGCILVGITNFRFINDTLNEKYTESETIIPMEESTFIHDFWYDNIEYIESDSNDIKLVYRHSKYFDISVIENYDESLELHLTESYSDPFILINGIIEDINHEEIINYSKVDLKIYASKENIEKLKANKNEYYKRYDSYENELQEAYNENERLKQRIYELERELSFYE